jgi:CubicO group peptidase (beta-lactamase class C family)
MSIERWLHRLVDDVDNRCLARGVQACVIVDDEIVVDWAYGCDGLGRPYERTAINIVYCAGKPLLALAVMSLCGSGEFSLADPVGRFLPSSANAQLAALPLSMLLSHEAGLFRGDALAFETLPPDRHLALAMAIRPSGVSAPGYSEYAAWVLLTRVVESVTGMSVAYALRVLVEQPLQLRDLYFGSELLDVELIRSRLAPNAAQQHDGSWRPRIYDVTPAVVSRARPAIGYYASASGLARFYATLLRQVRDPDRSAPSSIEVAAMVRPWSSRARDPVMNRVCSYGLGFMTSLSDHRFGTALSARSFGHSGYKSTTFAFADPERRLVCAAHFVGFVEARRAIEHRREASIDLLLDALVAST